MKPQTFNGFRVYPIHHFLQELREEEPALRVGSEYPGLATAYFTGRAGTFTIADTKEATEGFLNLHPDDGVIFEIVEGGGQMTEIMRAHRDFTALWPPVLRSSISVISHMNGPDAERKKAAREKVAEACLTAYQQTTTHEPIDLLRERLGETAWREMTDFAGAERTSI